MEKKNDKMKNMPKICQKYAKNMPKICQKYAKNKKSLRYVFRI